MKSDFPVGLNFKKLLLEKQSTWKHRTWYFTAQCKDKHGYHSYFFLHIFMQHFFGELNMHGSQLKSEYIIFNQKTL